jgi:hypothetical protein
MKIAQKIIQLLEKQHELSVKEMVDILQVSKQGIHIAINTLLENGQVEKFGKAPKTIYKLKTNITEPADSAVKIDKATANFLLQHFLLISEVGKIMEGIEGFVRWCKQRNLPVEKTIEEYKTTIEKYNQYYNELGIINGNEKLQNTKGYDGIFLDDIYYCDFYAIERFGKTRLGTLLHYAKQGQNKFLMKMLLDESKKRIENLIKKEKFDAIGIVPPTIRREVQLMKYMETHLKINLPKIKIQKISGIIPVPQKSLNKLDERINNANSTFAINETVKYKHILLIDDAVGSGSTLNQIAFKIKQKEIAKKVTGLALVGSFKGFDVVTDV